MKFWQLVSVLRGSNILEQLVLEDPRWEEYYHLLEDFNRHVDAQNRDVLDRPVDSELCRVALQAWPRRFWINENGHLVQYRPEQDKDVEPQSLISAYDTYERYGGDVLEDVLEYGSVKVSPSALT